MTVYMFAQGPVTVHGRRPRFSASTKPGASPVHAFAYSRFRFNSDLILLKPLRNRDELPYRQRGGTDHGELKSPC
jgi:hypothetical protein